MDSVRFGRVLGLGARMAAKTLAGAVDAATAPNPNGPARAEGGPAVRPPAVASVVPAVKSTPQLERAPAAMDDREVQPAGPTKRGSVGSAGARTARATVKVRETGRGLKQGGKRFGEAVWGPVARLSGVLWLEVTGVFFGLFALSAGVGAWKLRGAVRAVPADHEAQVHLAVAAAVALLFGYFCLTSFARARRRERAR